MKNLINGNFYEKECILEIKSPITNETLSKIQALNEKDVDYAIQSSKKAFSKWSKLSNKERSNYIHKIAEELYKLREDIARTMQMEIAKPYKQSLSEVDRTVEIIHNTAEEILRMNFSVYNGGNYDISSKNKMAIVKNVPYGVVLCIAPFNYPINLSASKIVAALVSGNTVIFKPPTQGSLSALMLVKAIYNANLPKGVFNSITGKGSEIGDYLNSHKDIDFINFTGSTSVGKNIAKNAGFRPMIMELGGKDAAIVLEDADLDKASKEIINGAFSYSGQRCTAIKRVLVLEEVADKLVDKLNEDLKGLKVGSAVSDVDVSELIDSKTADYIEKLILDTMKTTAVTKQNFKRESNLIYPMIFDKVEVNSRIAIEEPFGPVLPVIRVKDIKEAIKISNSSEYGLQSSIFTKDFSKSMYIAENLEVGTVHINNKTQRGPDNFPFMGYKNSGVGVQGIKFSIENMTKLKSIVFDMLESE